MIDFFLNISLHFMQDRTPLFQANQFTQSHKKGSGNLFNFIIQIQFVFYTLYAIIRESTLIQSSLFCRELKRGTPAGGKYKFPC